MKKFLSRAAKVVTGGCVFGALLAGCFDLDPAKVYYYGDPKVVPIGATLVPCRELENRSFTAVCTFPPPECFSDIDPYVGCDMGTPSPITITTRVFLGEIQDETTNRQCQMNEIPTSVHPFVLGQKTLLGAVYTTAPGQTSLSAVLLSPNRYPRTGTLCSLTADR